MPRVFRVARATLLPVLLAAVCAAPAQAAHWTTVSGLIPGSATDAALDGPRVLVTSLSGRNLVVTTIAGDRVARRQTMTTAGRAGTIRYLQVARLRGGRALAVWQEPGAIRASLRPSAGARFSPAVTVSRFPGADTGAALVPALAVTPAGEAVVAFLGGPAGGRLGIQSATLPPGGSIWTAPVDVSAGTLPQFPGAGLSAALPLAAVSDHAGGVVVAWGQPPVAPGSRPALDVVSAVRSPAGVWGAPLPVGSGGFGLTLAAPAPGEFVAAWRDGPCADAATVRGTAVALVEVVCRPGTLVGQIGLARTTSGGAVLAVLLVAQPVPGASPIEVAARDALGGWGPSRPAIAGPADLAGAVESTGGRTAIPAVVARGVQFNRLRVAVVGADGTVLRRIDGPARPTPPRHTSVRVLPLGPGARVALLLTPAPTLSSSRPSILTLG